MQTTNGGKTITHRDLSKLHPVSPLSDLCTAGRKTYLNVMSLEFQTFAAMLKFYFINMY